MQSRSKEAPDRSYGTTPTAFYYGYLDMSTKFIGYA